MILDKVCEMFQEKKDFQFLKGDGQFELKPRPKPSMDFREDLSPNFKTNQ